MAAKRAMAASTTSSRDSRTLPVGMPGTSAAAVIVATALVETSGAVTVWREAALAVTEVRALATRTGSSSFAASGSSSLGSSTTGSSSLATMPPRAFARRSAWSAASASICSTAASASTRNSARASRSVSASALRVSSPVSISLARRTASARAARMAARSRPERSGFWNFMVMHSPVEEGMREQTDWARGLRPTGRALPLLEPRVHDLPRGGIRLDPLGVQVSDLASRQGAVPDADVLHGGGRDDVHGEAVRVGDGARLGPGVALDPVRVERESRAVVGPHDLPPLLRRDDRAARGRLVDAVVRAGLGDDEHAVDVVDRPAQVAPAAVQLGDGGRTREERDARGLGGRGSPEPERNGEAGLVEESVRSGGAPGGGRRGERALGTHGGDGERGEREGASAHHIHLGGGEGLEVPERDERGR